MVTSTIGSIEYWAFSTTVEVVMVRNQMYSKIGAQNAKKTLYKYYLWGVKDEVVRRRNDLAFDGILVDDKAEMGVIDTIVHELTQHYYDDNNRDTNRDNKRDSKASK